MNNGLFGWLLISANQSQVAVAIRSRLSYLTLQNLKQRNKAERDTGDPGSILHPSIVSLSVARQNSFVQSRLRHKVKAIRTSVFIPGKTPRRDSALALPCDSTVV